MKKTTVLICALALSILCGCKTVNPQTGVKEFDPVKTEQVRAVIKPMVSGGVAALLQKVPTSRPYIEQAAGAVCEMRDAKAFDPVNLRARLIGILDASNVKIDPLLRVSV